MYSVYNQGYNNNVQSCFTDVFKKIYIKRKQREISHTSHITTKDCSDLNSVSGLEMPYMRDRHAVRDDSDIRNDQIPLINNRPILTSFIKNKYESLDSQANGRTRGLKRKRETNNEGNSENTSNSDGNENNIFGSSHQGGSNSLKSPVQLLEDVFSALSVISLEFQNMEDHQIDMCMRLLSSCVQNIFKESILEHYEYIKKVFKINNITEIRKDQILIARRRGGKTFTTCAVIASILAVFPQQMILFFSTGSRISTMGRDTIIDILEVLIHSKTTKKFSNIKYETSKESLKVWSKDGFLNLASFYPSNVEACIHKSTK